MSEKLDYSGLSKEERLKLFDELWHAEQNGVPGVGWPSKTWGMIKSFQQMHKIAEAIMCRGVWTHEFGWPELLRKEIEDGHTGEAFGKSLHEVRKMGKKVIWVDPDIAGKIEREANE